MNNIVDERHYMYIPEFGDWHPTHGNTGEILIDHPDSFVGSGIFSNLLGKITKSLTKETAKKVAKKGVQKALEGAITAGVNEGTTALIKKIMGKPKVSINEIVASTTETTKPKKKKKKVKKLKNNIDNILDL